MLTVDQKQIVVDSFARYRIVDPLLFYQTVRNEDRRAGALAADHQRRNLRRVLGNVSMAAILTQQRAEFMQEIAAAEVNNVGRQSFGIKVIDVRIKRVDLPPENSQAIFRRMQTQREQEAAPDPRRRPEGCADDARGSRQAGRRHRRQCAQAGRDPARRGRRARRRPIYAAAYGQDPNFFDFYRSMQALTQRACRGDTTTYVGPPDGDFFRYFLATARRPRRRPHPVHQRAAGRRARPASTLAVAGRLGVARRCATALGLVLVIEGLTFAAAPERAKRALAALLLRRRNFCGAIGVAAMVWAIRG